MARAAPATPRLESNVLHPRFAWKQLVVSNLSLSIKCQSSKVPDLLKLLLLPLDPRCTRNPTGCLFAPTLRMALNIYICGWDTFHSAWVKKMFSKIISSSLFSIVSRVFRVSVDNSDYFLVLLSVPLCLSWCLCPYLCLWCLSMACLV